MNFNVIIDVLTGCTSMILYACHDIMILFCITRSAFLSITFAHLFTFMTGFGKTDHNVTFDISRNTDLKY